jgi:signal transduction histidine kinase
LIRTLRQYFRPLALALSKRLQPFYFTLWDHPLRAAAATVLLIVAIGVSKADAGVRADLRLALLKTSADIGHLFQNYEAAQEYSEREILRLCKEDIDREKKTWRSNSRSFLLQAIAVPKSQDLTDRQVKVACVLSLNRWQELISQPVWIGDLPIADTWMLHAAINGGDYLIAQGRYFLKTSAPASLFIIALFIFPYFYRELLSVRHFEAAINTLLTVDLQSSNENEVIDKFADLARRTLHFDSAALYWIHDNVLTLRALDPKDENPNKTFWSLRNPMPLESDYVEAVAARTNTTIRLNYPKAEDANALKNSRAWSSAPYLAVPIHDPDAKAVVGVLTAEKVHGFQPSNQLDLESLMHLAMLLVLNVRATVRLKDQMKRLMKQTRQVALGTVVPVVAHNIRTNILMAKTAALDLAEKWQQFDPKVREERLHQIEDSMKSCSAVLERILTYRKIGMAAPNKENGGVDLCEVLANICGFFESYFEITQVRFEKRFELNPIVAIDALDLLQVITNLFINADDALREVKSAERTSALSILVTRSHAPAGVRIRVSDNGHGVPPEIRSRIFDDEFTTKADGTGAGLPYCLQVIEQAGGTLKLDQYAPGPGATFEIYLPVVDEGVK